MRIPVVSLALMMPLAAGAALSDADFSEEEPTRNLSLPFFSGVTTFDASAEALLAPDIEIVSTRFAFLGDSGDWALDLGIGGESYRLDYRPVFFGSRMMLEEETLRADLAVTRSWNDQWETSLNFRAYGGFAEYRSIWIAEFYRQLFGAFPVYTLPDPHGAGLGAGVTWEYQPNAGEIELSLDFGRDVVAPGWAFNPGLGRPAPDREVLKTVSGRLRVEQALSGWLKTELIFSARDTTARHVRYGIQNAWAAVHGPFAFRVTGGYAEEAPAFNSLYGSVLAQWNFHPEWSVHLGGRLYSDTGEIETGGFNAAAPGLDSSEVFAGVTWDRGDLAIGLTVGLIEAGYERLSPGNQFFGNLYQDRDWWSVRLAGSLTF